VSKFAWVLIVVPLLFVGCGEADSDSNPASGPSALERQVKRHQAAVSRAEARQRARAAARRHHRHVVARRHRAQVRVEEAERRAAVEAEAAEVAELAAEEEAAVEEEASECDPNYSGCLDPLAYDYDCEGGSGDGPEYTGTVSVVGEDHYGLDADSDGTGCEPY
jgi:hypothetical protein